MKLNLKITVFLLAFTAIQSRAQNILNMEGWVIGSGSTTGFNQNGLDTENVREWGEGPEGKRAILWKAAPNGANDNDGGWNTPAFPVVHTNTYRYSVWLKKTNSFDGSSYFGCLGAGNLNGTSNDNPYFWSGKLPELNKWYLLVGYIHGSGDPSTVSYGGVYDGVTGAKVASTVDYKFPVIATSAAHRSYLYYDKTTADRQYFYAPRVDVVNGNEPTIASLLGISGTSGTLSYFPGQVGIKTTNPGSYDLAVKGKIHAQEVMIDVTNWPDYVFGDDYKLKSLAETEKFIKLNKHLPNIQSAKDAASNGTELGEMNKKLLQKIEELTLHLIEQDKRLQIQEAEIKTLKRKMVNN